MRERKMRRTIRRNPTQYGPVRRWDRTRRVNIAITNYQVSIKRSRRLTASVVGLPII